MAQRKLVLYIAMSLDGFIAAPGDDLSFLNPMMQTSEDYGYNDFIKTVDTKILGRKTYDWVMKQVKEFPHNGIDTYVITRTPRKAIGPIQFYTGDLEELIISLKKKPGKNIFCDGGAEIVNALLKKGLIDEMTISVIPALLGGGTRLFAEGYPARSLVLKQCRSFNSGLVLMHYTS
jgi:dihydrofolate reductase